MTGSSASKNRPVQGDPFRVSLVLATLLLMLVTVINQFLIDPYTPISAPVTLIGPGALSTGSEAAVTVQNDRVDHIIRRDFHVPSFSSGASHVQIRADVVMARVVGGDRRWKAARVLLNRKLPGGKLYWESPHVVFRGIGDLRVEGLSGVLPATGASEGMNLRVELLLATGELKVDRLTLQPVARSDGAVNSERFLLICWIVLIVMWSAGIFRRRVNARRGVIIFLTWGMAMTAIGLSTLPSGTSQPIFSYVWTQITLIRSYLPRTHEPKPLLIRVPVAEKEADSDATPVRVVNISHEEAAAGRFDLSKIAHVAVFIVIGTLFALYGSGRLVSSIFVTTLFSVVAELMQTFAISRSPSLFDAGLNTGGAVLGVLTTIILMALYRRATGR